MATKDEKWKKFQYSGPTNDELTLIRDCILLPHMQTMILHAIEEIELSRDLLKEIHLESARALLRLIDKDYYRLRAELKQRSIKLLDEEQSQNQKDGVLYYPYVCRGYQDRFGIMREVAKAEISVRLTNYMRDLATLLLGR